MKNSTVENRRKQAIDDGRLIDVTDFATRLGIPCEVALTASCWDRCVEDDKERLTAILDKLKIQFANSEQLMSDAGKAEGEPEFFEVVLPKGLYQPATLFRLGTIWSPGNSQHVAATVYVSEAWW